jgi:hypothetical protein
LPALDKHTARCALTQTENFLKVLQSNTFKKFSVHNKNGVLRTPFLFG